MILRVPDAADIPALARFARTSFVSKFGHLYQPEDLTAFLQEAFSEAAIAAELADPQRRYCLAVDEAGQLGGYCKIALDTGFPDHARGRAPMELKQLYTDPERTGQGIGALLMDWAMAQFRAEGGDEVHLSVWSENFGAQRFYARYGFTKVADVVFMVGNHRDHDLLYARML